MNAAEFGMVKRVYTRTCIYIRSVFSSCEHGSDPKGETVKTERSADSALSSGFDSFLVGTSYMANSLVHRRSRHFARAYMITSPCISLLNLFRSRCVVFYLI